MNILYVTNNAELRSTTTVLEAIFKYRKDYNLTPIVAFNENGAWKSKLESEGIECFIREQRIPNKSRPLEFFNDFIFWFRIIKKYNIDIIQVNEHDLFPMLKFVAKFAKLPVVVGVHFVLTSGFAHWAFSKGYCPNKLLFTSYDQLEKSKEGIPDYVNENSIIVFGHGHDFDSLTGKFFDADVSHWEIPRGHTVIGTASSIEPRKRLDDFIRVIHNLKDKGFSVKGVVAGGGKYTNDNYNNELKRLITKLGVEDDILFLGNLTDIRPFYSSIDIFLSTSELETFGMSVCEAMAFGKPVVAAEGGSVKEVLGNSEYTFDNYDCDGMAEAIGKLINNPLVAKKVGEMNKKRVFDNFNAPVLARKISEIYLNVLSDSNKYD